jgi:YVTN family beta-propeller protein
MKLIASLLILGSVVSLAPGQWVEKTIVLPDSLSGFGNPGTMLYNTGNNFLFIGCENGVAIVDGLSDRLIARTSTRNLRDYAACYASRVNKLYWIGGEYGSITYVLDGATGRDLKRIGTPDANDICYNPVANRVYVTAHDTSGYLVVINAANDSVVRRLSLGAGFQATVCCDAADNKVYVMSYIDGAIFVVDCAADSIIDTLTVSSVPGQLVYNRLNDKLYCCSYDASVTIIDCHTDSVLGRIVLPGGVEAAAYNPVANKLYCDDGEGVDIISGQGDTLLGRVQFSRNPSAIVCDSTDNLMWCSFYSDTIYAIDGRGDSLFGKVAVGNSPGAMCYNPTRNRLYLREAHLTVVDPARQQLEKRILLGFEPVAVCWSAPSNKIYCAGRSEAVVAVISASNVLMGLIPVGRDPVALAYDRPLGLVCCANNRDSTVSIITCHGDSVIATVNVGLMPERLCVDTVLHKAWCSSESAVAVIDLQAESLVAVIRVPVPVIAALLADPARARVYCATAYDAHVVVLDAAGDTIIASVPVGGTAQDLSLNPGANQVYCATQYNDAVAVIDGASLRVVSIIPVGQDPMALYYNERHNKLYCANGYWDNDKTVTAIDCGTRTPVATIGLTVSPSALAYDSVADRLYCLSRYSDYVAVVDCQRDAMVTLVRVGSRPVAAVHAPPFRRMYVANEDGFSLSVIRDTVHSGVESPDDLPPVAKPAPTVIRGLLMLDGLGTRSELPGRNSAMSRAALLDISGRKVLDLHSGANDVRALAPGVYFVREAQAQAQAVRKVVVTR